GSEPGIGQGLKLEVRSVAEEDPRYRDGASRSAQRRDCDPCVKSPHQLLEHEYRASARCAKCRGEPSAGTGGEECLDIVLVTAEGGRKKMPNAGPHLDGRPLSAQRPSPARHQRISRGSE